MNKKISSTNKKEEVKSVTLKKFTREIFLEKLSQLHLTLDLMEDNALELPKDDMYEIYLVVSMMHDEAKKLRRASKEILFGGTDDE